MENYEKLSRFRKVNTKTKMHILGDRGHIKCAQLSLITVLLTPDVLDGFFYTNLFFFFSRHQLGVLQFNSNPNYPELFCRFYRTTQSKVSDCLSPVFLTNQLAINRSSHDLPPHSIIWQNGSQNTGKHFTYYYWFIIRIQLKNSQTEEMYRAKHDLPSLGRPPSQYFIVLIYQEALQTHGLGVFWRFDFLGMTGEIISHW